jgi:hypothetical protein
VRCHVSERRVRARRGEREPLRAWRRAPGRQRHAHHPQPRHPGRDVGAQQLHLQPLRQARLNARIPLQVEKVPC